MELSQLRDILINEYDPDRTRTGEAEIEALDLLTALTYTAAYAALAEMCNIYMAMQRASVAAKSRNDRIPLHWIARVVELAFADYVSDESRDCWQSLDAWCEVLPARVLTPIRDELPWA